MPGCPYICIRLYERSRNYKTWLSFHHISFAVIKTHSQTKMKPKQLRYMRCHFALVKSFGASINQVALSCSWSYIPLTQTKEIDHRGLTTSNDRYGFFWGENICEVFEFLACHVISGSKKEWDIWPIQPTTRGWTRSFGFNFKELIKKNAIKCYH